MAQRLKSICSGGVGGLRSRLRLGALVLVFALLGAPAATAEVSLVFGTYAADKPTQTVKQFKPFLNYLAAGMSEVLGEPVSIKMKVAKQYEGGIDDLVSGAVDFARFGPASYVTAKSRADGISIVAVESKKGEKRFNGVIAVHADSEVQTLQQLAQHSFAFGDELSTIGRYLAQSHLLQAGIDSAQLSEFAFLGRHDTVGSAVGAGKFTAGALKESTFKKLVAAGVPIRALFTFDNVTKPWLAREGLEPRVLEAMRQVMLTTTDDAALRSIAKDGFLAGGDADYDFIRQAMSHSQMF